MGFFQHLFHALPQSEHGWWTRISPPTSNSEKILQDLKFLHWSYILVHQLLSMIYFSKPQANKSQKTPPGFCWVIPGMDHFLHDLVVSFLLQRHVLGMLRGNGWRFLCCHLYTGEVGRDQHQYHVDRNQDVSNHGDHATSVCTYTYRWWNGVGSKFGIYCIDCGGGCYQLAVLFGQCQGADKRGSEKIRHEFYF